MNILGISCWYHDSAAAIIKDGEIVAAAQEERFTRKKHDASFPNNAIEFCINYAQIDLKEIDAIVFYEKPFLKFERLLETYFAFAPRGFISFHAAMLTWLKDKLFQKSIIIKNLNDLLGTEVNWKDKILFSEHHFSHAASAFYPSPFKRAAVLTTDAVGEWSTTSVAVGNGSSLKILKEIHFPHSVGLLYSAFTYYLGFKVNSGEYKLMGLAPYGEPKYVDLIKDKLVNILDDGSFSLNMDYFDFCTGLKMTNKKFNKLFGSPPRTPEDKLTQRDMDIAASIQKVTEEIVLNLANNIALETKEKNLCLAGGVALNCVINGILLKSNIFENIWVQPASGDAGASLGAALGAFFAISPKERKISKQDSMSGAYLGPEFNSAEIKKTLIEVGAKFEEFPLPEIINKTSSALVNGKAIGWMQGRMEFGPRALGARSIIADPRSEAMQKQLNLKVKYRESFRPFAPSVLREQLSEWFQMDSDSPYMLFVSDVNESKQIRMDDKEEELFGLDKLNIPKSSIPAVTHVDYSSRIQTVHKNTNPIYHELITQFFKLTGCPIVVNTSFNVRGEPIVCSPKDAFKCFMGTDLDVLVIGNFILYKELQNLKLKEDYKNKYNLD